jgi:glycosyltransferase involved in cell wall biosynthesis
VPSPERRKRTRRELGIPFDAAVVGTVANLNPQKGIEYFIRAASLIHRRHPDCWFMVVGASYDTHADYVRQLRRELQETDIPIERFIFAGARDDVENYYPAMDVKLVTSVPRSEGTTTTGVEAMACGVPLVATDVGAVREILEDGKTAFVVPPNDPSAIAARVLILLNDPELRHEMGEAARSRALALFDTEVCINRYLKVFETALRRHSLATRPLTRPETRTS